MASGHEVSVRFTGDPRELIEACKTVENALSNMNKSTDDASNSVSKATGDTDGLSISFSKFKDVAKEVVSVFKEFIKVLDEYSQYALESERATVSLMTSIANSGRDVTTELNKFRDLADEISNSTLFQDKQVEQAEAFLIATQQLDDELTERTLKVATDLATMMGDNLPNTAKALSRALTDPTYATFAFQRAGIKLSDTTSDLAKQLMEEGRQAEAQVAILEELEARYGGLAESVGGLDSAEMTKLKNDILDIKEALGQIMASKFSGLLETLNDLLDKIKLKLDEWANKAKGKNAVDDAMDGDTTYQQLARLYTPEQLQEAFDEAERRKENLKKYGNAQGYQPSSEIEEIQSLYGESWWTHYGSVNKSVNDLVKAQGIIAKAISEQGKKVENNTNAVTENTEATVDKESFAYKYDEYKKRMDDAYINWQNANSQVESDYYKRLYDDAKKDFDTFAKYGVDYNTWLKQQDDGKAIADFAQMLRGEGVYRKDAFEQGSMGEGGGKFSAYTDYVKKNKDNFTIESANKFISNISSITGMMGQDARKDAYDAIEMVNNWIDEESERIRNLEAETAELAEKERQNNELFKRNLYWGISGRDMDEGNMGEGVGGTPFTDIIKKYGDTADITQMRNFRDDILSLMADTERFQGLSYYARRDAEKALKIVENAIQEIEDKEKQARLERMHEMNDALLKEREKGLKKMADIEEFHWKKSLDTFIDNFGEEHEDPFIGYSESIDMMTGAMSSFYNTIRNGQGVLEAFKNAFFRVVDQIIEKLIALLAVEAISSIFGLNGAEISNAAAYTMDAGKHSTGSSLSSGLSKAYSNMSSGFTFKNSSATPKITTVNFNIDGFVSSNEADFTRRIKETMNTGEFLVNIT